MSSRRELLVTAIKQRLLDTSRHVDTLRAACAQFESDFDLQAFVTAWNGRSQEQRIAAYAVQAGYENSINGAIKIAQELSELSGWTPPNQQPNSNEALRKLRESGVITAKALTSLKDAYEARSKLQHDYANTLARDIHEATFATLDAVPELLQNVHLYVTQNYP
jgi:uncharacterized protein YutE (UPF0331/DUF86 family)